MAPPSALLLLLPVLLNLQKIPDDSVQKDLAAVDSAIASVNLMKDPRTSLQPFEQKLTEAQRALLKRHWELETIQTTKPGAPVQFELGLFAEALGLAVEMDEQKKEVKLRMDKLDEWAGVEPKKKELEENREEEPIVTVGQDGEVHVKKAENGGNGQMLVRKAVDANGNPEVVVTFVKKEDKQEHPEEEVQKSSKVVPQQQQKDVQPEQPQPHVIVVPEPQQQKEVVDEMTSMQEEEEEPPVEVIVAELPAQEASSSSGFVRNLFSSSSEQPSQVESSSSGVVRNLFSSSPLLGAGPLGSLFNFMFGGAGRKKRETNEMREDVQRMADGRMLHTRERKLSWGQPGSGFSAKVEMLSMSVDSDEQPQQPVEEQQQQPAEEKSVEKANEKTTAGGDPKKAEIKQYLEQYVANTDGQKKAEKLAYVWYAELLYWTSKWVEALESRVSGVRPELVVKFMTSAAGQADYKDLKGELDGCASKMAQLKAWIGEYYKR